MRLIVPITITDARLISSTVDEDDHAVWSSGTTYAAGDRVIRTQTHRIYESLVSSNLNHVPEDSATQWFDLGPTNRWAMFDTSASTATTASSELLVQLDLPTFNDLVLTEVVGDSVIVNTPLGITTVSVPAPVAPATTSTVYITDLASPPGTVDVTVEGSGTVAVGALSVGTLTTLGETQHGSGLGVIDYSSRIIDEFGSATFVKRGYSRRVNANIVLPTSDVDRVATILAAVRSVPVVWIGSGYYQAMLIFGYYREWTLEARDYITSTLTLVIESLVLDAPEVPPPELAPPPGGALALDLSNPNLESVATSADDSAEAGLTLRNDGRAYAYTKVNGAETSGSFVASQWSVSGIIDPALAALYEVQFGTGIWQGLSVDRFVSAYATTGQDISVATSARIRLIGTDVILASCPINLRAAVPAVPPPPPPAPPDPPTSLGLDAEYTQTASFDVPSTMIMWLRLFRNGTWSIVTPDTGTPTTGDWHSSPASDVGDSYQARVTVTAGAALVPTNQMNTWTLLNATRSFIMEIIVPGTGTVEFTLEVRAVAGASIGSSDSLFTLTGTSSGGGGRMMRLLVPDKITDAKLLSSSVPEVEAPPWSSGETYGVAATVISPSSHSVFESLQAANLNRAPDTSPAWWVRRGPTNRWAMFDGSASTVSSSSDGAIIVDLDVGVVEDITFIDLVAAEIRITASGLDVTRSVPAPVAPATSVTLTIGALGFAGGALRISITGSGTVSVGNVSLGSYLSLGDTQHGVSLGIIDYSRKVTDDFGNISVVRRGYSRRVTARVAVLPGQVDTVSSQLAAVRATPCVWDVSPRHQAFSVYGYYTDWQFDIAFPTLAFFTITLESMYEEGYAVTPGASVSAPRTLAQLNFNGLPVVDEVAGHDIVLAGWTDNGLGYDYNARISTTVTLPSSTGSMENFGVAPEIGDGSNASPTARTRSNAALDPIDPPMGVDAVTYESFIYVPSTGGTLTDAGFEFDALITDQNYDELEIQFNVNFGASGADTVDASVDTGPGGFGEPILPGSVADAVTGLTLPRDQWLHLACVVTRTSLRLFVDGERLINATITGMRDAGIADCSFTRMRVNPEKRVGTRPMYQGCTRLHSGELYVDDFTPPTDQFDYP